MAATNPILIHVGRGDVFINTPVPVVPPVKLLVDGTPIGGTNVGSTLDVATLIYRPTTFDIKNQQSTGTVGYVTVEEDVRLEFHPGEMSYANLRDLTISRLDQGTFISLGGVIFPQLLSCMVVAPRRAGGFISAMIYQAVFAEDRSFGFQRQGHLSVRVAARAQAVTTRTEGDQLAYFHPNTPFGTPAAPGPFTG